jgi:hypothetical protein
MGEPGRAESGGSSKRVAALPAVYTHGPLSRGRVLERLERGIRQRHKGSCRAAL